MLAVVEIGLGFKHGFYAIAALASLLFVLRFVPETNRRQLEDMD